MAVLGCLRLSGKPERTGPIHSPKNRSAAFGCKRLLSGSFLRIPKKRPGTCEVQPTFGPAALGRFWLLCWRVQTGITSRPAARYRGRKRMLLVSVGAGDFNAVFDSGPLIATKNTSDSWVTGARGNGEGNYLCLRMKPEICQWEEEPQ